MWIVVALLLIVVLYPQLWMILGSFKTQTEFFENPTWALPETFNLDNYVAALTRGNVALNYRNSLLVTIPSVFFILILGVAAGYVLEVMIWKGRRTVLLFILAGIMVPGQMILVPLFTVYFRLGLTNTLWPLILTYTAMGLPLTTFLMAAYFRSLPREIFEAATVDGSGPLRSFFVIGAAADEERDADDRARAVLQRVQRSADRADVHHAAGTGDDPGGPAEPLGRVRLHAVRTRCSPPSASTSWCCWSSSSS